MFGAVVIASELRDGGDVVFDFLQTALQGRRLSSGWYRVNSPDARTGLTEKTPDETEIDLQA